MAKKRPRKTLAREIVPSGSRPAPARAADQLLADIRGLIEQARRHVAQTVNSAMVALYWQIGKRIREDILHEKRAEYGERIVATLAAQLTAEYGRGFGRRNLLRMVRFAEVFQDERIVSSLMTQLSWTHLIYIIPIDAPLKRDFYAEMCRLERWSVRTLQKKIDGYPRRNSSASCTTPYDLRGNAWRDTRRKNPEPRASRVL